MAEQLEAAGGVPAIRGRHPVGVRGAAESDDRASVAGDAVGVGRDAVGHAADVRRACGARPGEGVDLGSHVDRRRSDEHGAVVGNSVSQVPRMTGSQVREGDDAGRAGPDKGLVAIGER